jgi:hypothetical protein
VWVCTRCDAVSSGPTKGVAGEVRRKYVSEHATSLHACRYYRVALTSVLNRGKLWVKGLLHLLGSRLSDMSDALFTQVPRKSILRSCLT